MVLSKAQLEVQLHNEARDISDGKFKDDNPLDLSEDFKTLCQACRRGDLKLCQEAITAGANINARDEFDYTPLILASLCGHYEVVQVLLESGALCERDTFQGERCLYNALNDRIRNLLLQYDYSKSTDPLQPLASHITSLLSRDHPQTSDITLSTLDKDFHLHKYILSARSPYFRKKLVAFPDTNLWKVPGSVRSEALEIVIRYIYLAEVPVDLGKFGLDEEEILTGINKISKHMEILELFDMIVEAGDRRVLRQKRQDEVEKGRNQLDMWFRENVLKHKVVVNTKKAGDIRWDHSNSIFANVLLRADEVEEAVEDEAKDSNGKELNLIRSTQGPLMGIPVGPVLHSQPSASTQRPRQSVLIPAHIAMLIRSEFFLTMFSSSFKESQRTEYLHIISIDCSPEVLEIVLTYLYTERTDFALDYALDVLFIADELFLEKLKVKSSAIISTLGNGTSTNVENGLQHTSSQGEEVVNIYDVLRAGWITRVHRLEEFAARYLAYRLEDYIDEEEFANLIRESASRITARQEIDSIELLDDIRYYLNERFRMRFEDAGITEMIVSNVSDKALIPEDTNLQDSSHQASASTATGEEPDGRSEENPTWTQGTIQDEFDQDAHDYDRLMEKIDLLLEKLKLDA